MRNIWRFAASNIAGIAATLILAGCSAQPEPKAVDHSNELVAQAAREIQRGCIATAMNATITRQPPFVNASALADAFKPQELADCPQDFREKFVALGNSVELLGSADVELAAHLGREQAAKQASASATVSDLWNGQPSGNSPWSDWAARKGQLETLVSQRRQGVEEGKAAALNVAAKYELFLNSQGMVAGEGIPEPMVLDTGNAM